MLFLSPHHRQECSCDMAFGMVYSDPMWGSWHAARAQPSKGDWLPPSF